MNTIDTNEIEKVKNKIDALIECVQRNNNSLERIKNALNQAMFLTFVLSAIIIMKLQW